MWYGQEGQKVQNSNASSWGKYIISGTYLQYMCNYSAKFQNSALKTVQEIDYTKIGNVYLTCFETWQIVKL